MSNENKGSKEPSFKVEDKRRFESDGADKEVSAGHGFVLKDQTSEKEEEASPEINLVSFIMSLATQAMMQLGEMPPIEGQPVVEKNIGYAQQTIEVLSMLQKKTQGNLDEFEVQIFEDILHSLRMSYIKAKAA